MKLRDLVPDPKNANKGTPRGRALLEDSLRRYGAGRSLLADKHGVIIAGNKTAEVAADIGLDNVIVVPTDGHQLVVVQRTDLDLATDPAAKELAIADNRTSQVSLDWDVDVLQQVAGEGVDLSRFFTSEELDALLAREPTEGLTDPDAVPEERPTDIVRGDLFALGDHRLLCGDSTSAEDVARVMDGTTIDAVVSDPPYGMGFDSSWYGTPEHPSKFALEGKAQWDKNAFDPRPIAALSRNVALFGANYYCTRLPEEGTWWVWDKRCSEAADQLIGIPFELVWFSGKRAHRIIRHNWAAITARDEPGPRHHPTQKPIAVVGSIIEYLTSKSAVIYEPFSGSGTTLIACEQLGRRCYAIEIEPRYVQVAIDRWEQFTGKKAQKL